MRYLALTLVFLLPVSTFAFGEASLFNFSKGSPSVVSDGTATCTSQPTARFNFTSGSPAVVHDATATCTAAVTTSTVEDIIWFH